MLFFQLVYSLNQVLFWSANFVQLFLNEVSRMIQTDILDTTVFQSGVKRFNYLVSFTQISTSRSSVISTHIPSTIGAHVYSDVCTSLIFDKKLPFSYYWVRLLYVVFLHTGLTDWGYFFPYRYDHYKSDLKCSSYDENKNLQMHRHIKNRASNFC